MDYKKFADYMYYLLPTPFKKLRKRTNQWYIYCRVLGAWFDTLKTDLLKAADETSIATCDDDMLRYYADDRNLTQYQSEDNDTFRSRIAMNDEIVSLGGTRDGILISAGALGYVDAEHIWCPVEDGNLTRWAEFVLKVNVAEGVEVTVPHNVLRSEIRSVKESISLDNYRYCYQVSSRWQIMVGIAVTNMITIGDH